jgi:hypothetical protein
MKNSNNAKPTYETRGSLGSLFINDTAAHAGPFENFQALTACVADLSAGNLSGAGNNAVTIPAGVTVYGKWSAITLASGTGQAFNATIQI